MNPSDAMREALARTWEKSKSVILERMQTLEAVAMAVAGNRLSPQLREKGSQEAHKLAGTLGTFGFPEGTRLAREVELLLEGDVPLDEARRAQLGELVPALRRELDRPRP